MGRVQFPSPVLLLVWRRRRGDAAEPCSGRWRGELTDSRVCLPCASLNRLQLGTLDSTFMYVPGGKFYLYFILVRFKAAKAWPTMVVVFVLIFAISKMTGKAKG